MGVVKQSVIWLFVLLLTACGGGGGSTGGASSTNGAPIANAGVNQLHVLGSGNVLLDGTASSDPDSDGLTFLWSFSQVPARSNATLNTANSDTSSFTPDLVGFYEVQLTVDDGTVSDAITVQIDVAANVAPVADAGSDIDVDLGASIQLDGSSSADSNGQSLTYRWIQRDNDCPDVTAGVGHLTGESPLFNAPDAVCTLLFDLRVDDGQGESFADLVAIYVLEDASNALFVDTANGNDSNPGTRSLPLQTIQEGINTAQLAGNFADLYVAQGTYTEATITLVDGISLYGGYDPTPDWDRQVGVFTTTIQGQETAISGSSVSNLTIDGFTITSANNAIPSSQAILLASSQGVVISNNIITSGVGQDGMNGTDGAPGIDGENGKNGFPGSCDGVRGLGGNGGSLTAAYNGGRGGNGGAEGTNDGQPGFSGLGPGGGAGGTGGAYDDAGATFTATGNPGGNGGNGGSEPRGTNGSNTAQLGIFGSSYATVIGLWGSSGDMGSGGGGGGGGGAQAGIFIIDGGGNGGGGGGEGGTGGTGAAPGESGAGSFALYLYGSTNIQILDNTITASAGGSGGLGGTGGAGGLGGTGGVGATTCIDEIGAGGHGGHGGSGGDGGSGGSGAGGPSIGIAYGAGSTITESGNSIYTASPSAGGVYWAPGLSQDVYNF